MRSFFAKLTYRIWLVFGGRRTESGFRLLSADIIADRQLRHELRGEIRSLKQRVWGLEDHTDIETLDMLAAEVEEYAVAMGKVSDRQKLEVEDA